MTPQGRAAAKPPTPLWGAAEGRAHLVPEDGKKRTQKNSLEGPRDAGEFFLTSFPVLFDLLRVPANPGSPLGSSLASSFSEFRKIGAGVLFDDFN